VLVARHPNRPGLEDYIQRLFPGFVEIHGDRRFADDHAIMTGFAEYHEQPVLLVGHVKGRDTKEKIYRNFGYARPEGYRKAMRVMKMAEKFRRPIIVFVDTPAAYPGIESEERGVAEAIAVNLRDMMLLETPVIVIVSGGRRQRRGTWHRDWGQNPHAGIRHLQRDPARGVRRARLA
jgi:acetyl-CoA carboxylase carboxyl transferase subunit alpha